MQQVNGGAENVHLATHSRHLVAYTWHDAANGSQLLRAVLDVPDLIVKVSR